LASLAAQTRRPDELVVEDDGSTDDTIALLRNFSTTAGFPVRIGENPHTAGPAKNFERAISRCSGDVIALCDQDDIWHPDKLALIADGFDKNPRAVAFFSDAEVCDMQCDPLGYRLWKSVGLTRRMQRRLNRGKAFDVILRQNVVTGATMAFASRYRLLVLPIDPRWMHDGWIALLISVFAPVIADSRPLIRYRQHPRQSVGAARRSLYQQYLNARKMDRTVFAEQAEMYQSVIRRLEQVRDDAALSASMPAGVSAQHLQRLAEKVRHYQTRSSIRLREQSRVLPSLTELLMLRYQRFSLGWKSFAQDLFL
jgi:glycosyltransferase involved in cell wall biosynthesis